VSPTLRQRLALVAYGALLRLVVPLYLWRVRRRGRAEPLYAQFIGERRGRYEAPAVPGALWLHAVSLGETRAAAPLLTALREALPGVRLLLTHGTATGRAAGAALLAPGDAQAWLPFDTPGAVRRFFDHFAPIGGVVMETEIWPNLLAEARRRGLSVVLANARLSARSRSRGARVDALLRPAFASLAATFAQTEADAERLREAGADPVRVEGNLKFDLVPEPRLLALGRHWKGGLGGRPVVLGAVTREGEEATLLEVWRHVRTPRPLLVIVPRHPQRFEDVAVAILAAGYSMARRSAWTDAPPSTAATADVWLGDSMQEMPAWYALADAALLGGSFAPLGGQNLIEAAACGCPVVMGPHTFNFADAAERSLAAGAAVRVPDMAAGVAEAARIATHPVDRERLAKAALSFARVHRGAAARMAAGIVERLRLGG